MIRINTVFDILDWQIITLFYKKKYSLKIRVIRLICVLITLLRQPQLGMISGRLTEYLKDNDYGYNEKNR